MTGSNILITGASSGIGRELAIQYAQLGYQVFAGRRDIERLQQLQQQHSNITPLYCDVTDLAALLTTCNSLPALDILLLNAGNCEYINDAKQFDGELFARIINTNLISVGYCLQAWLPQVKSGGKLAITSSSAAFVPLPRAEAYGASKAGLSYLANSLRLDLHRHIVV